MLRVFDFKAIDATSTIYLSRASKSKTPELLAVKIDGYSTTHGVQRTAFYYDKNQLYLIFAIQWEYNTKKVR